MEQVYFIDKFIIPKNSIEEFTKRMNDNRDFITTLAGFIKSEAFQQKDEEGNLVIITIAMWQNQDYVDKAKGMVQAEFKRIGFNPNDFYQRLNIKLERGLYEQLRK